MTTQRSSKASLLVEEIKGKKDFLHGLVGAAAAQLL
jgi:hypothetical protein